MFNNFFKDGIVKEPEVDILIKNSKEIEEKCTLREIIGKGGSKIAIKIDGGKVIIVPNHMETEEVLKYWERLVEEEVKMGQLLQKLGLLCPKYKRASVIHDDIHIPVLISKSFAQMANKNQIFVIDIKNPGTSIWKKGIHAIFESKEDRLLEKSWHTVLEPLTKDIAKLITYNIPTHLDSFNLAIEKRNESYVLRYFGFDFTNKSKSIEIPSGERLQTLKIDEQFIKNLINDALFSIFEIEFASQEDEKTLMLQQSLAEWGLHEVMKEINKSL